MDKEEGLRRLAGAKTTREKSSILSEMVKSGTGAFDQVIIDLMRGRHNVSWNAVRILAMSGDPRAEDTLIEFATKADDEYLVTEINAALGAFGTRKSIAYLLSRLESNKSDVRCSALFAIGMIGGPSAEEICVKALGAGRSDLISYAEGLIAINGSARCEVAMRARIKHHIKKPPRISHSPNRLVLGFYYLSRIGCSVEIGALAATATQQFDDEEWGIVRALAGDMTLPDGFANHVKWWTARHAWAD